jgi:regulator of protease activity HflC (stomatin/prohibitin superfamily)
LYIHGARHFTGLGRTFKTFDSLWRRIHIESERIRSYDGLPIDISYAYTYKVNHNKDDLYRFYLDFGPDGGEKKVFELLSAQTIRNVGSMYAAFDYFEYREEINDLMFSELNSAFSRLYCEVTTFQITNLEVPYEFADKIEDTQVAIQEVYVAGYEQEKVIISAQSLREVATTLANITIMEANATAAATLREVEAESNAMLFRVAQQAESLSNLVTDWGLTQDEALAYMHMTAIKESRTSSLSMGIQYPAAFSFLNQ